MLRRLPAVIGCLLLAACGASATPARPSAGTPVRAPASSPASPAPLPAKPSATGLPTSSEPAQSPTTSTLPTSSPSPRPTSSTPTRRQPTQPPPSTRPSRTGTLAGHRNTSRLLGRVRIVAEYGAAGNGALGVLGTTGPEQAAEGIERRAAAFAGYGLPVQPAMELLATVAQGAPGADGDYSAPVAPATLQQYLDVAHRHHMLLILDLQPGRASFLEQAQRLGPLLLDPSVQLALDPEWKVGPGQQPGNGLIGSSPAAGINEVGRWLSGLVLAHALPDKLLVVHEFTPSMLPDRALLTQHPGVEMVLHADGFGQPSSKIAVLRQLAFPHPPFGTGFKLFLTQDSRLMSPAEVMALAPRPDVITYQ